MHRNWKLRSAAVECRKGGLNAFATGVLLLIVKHKPTSISSFIALFANGYFLFLQ